MCFQGQGDLSLISWKPVRATTFQFTRKRSYNALVVLFWKMIELNKAWEISFGRSDKELSEFLASEIQSVPLGTREVDGYLGVSSMLFSRDQGQAW
jgi:hypothetical protein